MRELIEALERHLSEDREAMIVSWAKGFKSLKGFEAAVDGGRGFKSASHVHAHMDRNTKGRLAGGVRAELEREGKWWVLSTVPLSKVKLTHKDTMRGEFRDVDTKVPIVIGAKMQVLDGRHRTTLAKQGGVKVLPAWMPASAFYRLKVSRN